VAQVGTSIGFVKLMRSEEALTLALTDGRAHQILTVIAIRASRTNNPITKMRQGQARIGSAEFGMSRQAYRLALKRLSEMGLITSKGTNKGTLATLTNRVVWDINDGKGTSKETIKEPSRNHQGTTNKKEKKGKKGKKYIPTCPVGIDPSLWTEYLKTRSTLKAPNTERAINTLVNRIAKLVDQGCDPNELVATANSHGWKTVYPPKEDRPNEQTARQLATDTSWATPVHTEGAAGPVNQ